MKKKIVYSDEPLGKIKIVKDFLPPPEELVFREENVEVRLPLSRRSVAFFKKQAKKHHISYEQIIRTLVDDYASHYDR